MSLSQAADNLKLVRQELYRSSILDFAKHYFPQYTTSPFCSFHEDICKRLIALSEKRNGRLAIAAPRGYAKSTLVSFFYLMWSICYNKERFILILSATAKQAQTLLSDIARTLEDNTKLLEDFPDVFLKGGDVKTKSTQHEIITGNDIKVAALGWEQSFRGIRHHQDRPTLIILDDIDSEKNTYNAVYREKLYNYFTKTILNAGRLKGFNMVAVGTLLHLDSLLSRLIKPEEFPEWDKKIYQAVIFPPEQEVLWQAWSNVLYARDFYEEECGPEAADKFFEANKQEMLKGTKVLWPEVEDYYQLRKIKETIGSYAFDTEKQNDPRNAKDSLYDPDKFAYWDKDYANVDQLLASFGSEYSIIGACDPSVGVVSKNADYSAIIILAKHKGRLYVLDADIKQRSQDSLVQAIINYCNIRRPMEKFVIESNLFPELLVKYVRECAERENVIVPLKEIRNTKNKELRIFGMETYITKDIIKFSRSQQILLDQLKYFPRGDHDDGPDALEMALREAELNEVGFVHIERKDKHGRTIYDKDYGRSTPEEDAQDEDDDGESPPYVSLS
ncbi:MAG: phage terminase large subunit [Candidatus Omnitrophota bacterium]|jgi:predicted phage terminase large subunit-like protein